MLSRVETLKRHSSHQQQSYYITADTESISLK